MERQEEYIGGVSEEQRSEEERRFEELGLGNSSGASSSSRPALTTLRPSWLI